MKAPVSTVMLLVSWLVAGNPGGVWAARPELLPMPEPVVDRMEEIVRQQLEDARQRLDAALADEHASSEALLVPLAALGRLYLSYHLADAAETVFQNAARLAPDDARWPYYLGVLYQNQRQLDEAAAAFARALELEPGNGPALVRLARVRLLQDRDDLAEPLFRRALERQDLAAAANYGLGQIAFDRGDFAAAIERFSTTLALQPEAAAAHQSLGMAYRQSGDLERAREHLRQSGQAQVRFVDPLIQSLVAEGALAYMLHGIVAYRNGDYAAALERQRHALELDDDNPQIHRELALTLRRLGRHDEAIAEFRIVLRLDPENPRAHYELGETLAEGPVGEYDEAIAELRRAVELEPRLGAAQIALGRALADQGDFAGALTAYEQALAVAPDDPRARRGRALAISRLGRPEEGLAELEKLFTAASDDLDVALDLAALAAQVGRRGRAIEVLRQARELTEEAPRRALLSFNLANLLQEEGDVAGAITQYGAALAAEPDLRDARFNLALLLLKEARYTDAAAHLSRVLELAPEDAQARYLNATALLYTGRDAEARRVLEAGLGDSATLRLKHLLARLLATSEDPDVRDGQRAAALAQEVFAAEQTAEHAETVALALAAAGQLDAAVRWQSQLLAQAEKANAPAVMLQRLRDNLERFRAGEGGQRPWPTEVEKGS